LKVRGDGTCTTSAGCSDALCTGGRCCDKPCDGICQGCDYRGCVATPNTDNQCGSAGAMISCAAFSTHCRPYRDVPKNVCAAFGECVQPGDLDSCKAHTDAPDGTACSSAACGGAGSCMGGSCTCMQDIATHVPPRTVPPRSLSCDASGAGG